MHNRSILKSSSFGSSVLLQGVGDGFVAVILGNATADEKVVPCLVVSANPCENCETDRLVEEYPHVFSDWPPCYGSASPSPHTRK